MYIRFYAYKFLRRLYSCMYTFSFPIRDQKNLFVQNLFFFLSQKREMIAKVIIEYNSISRHIVCFWKPAPELLATVLISVIYPSLHCDLFFRVYTHELV